MKYYPCAKQRVVCVITDKNGKVVGVGENRCQYDVKTCPREDGEDYSKCEFKCGQVAHAEVVAVNFDMDRCVSEPTTAYVFGHKRVCDDCEKVLRSHGITNIVIVGADNG